MFHQLANLLDSRYVHSYVVVVDCGYVANLSMKHSILHYNVTVSYFSFQLSYINVYL